MNTIDIEKLVNRMNMAKKEIRETEDEILKAIKILWDALPPIEAADNETIVSAPYRNCDDEIVCDEEYN